MTNEFSKLEVNKCVLIMKHGCLKECCYYKALYTLPPSLGSALPQSHIDLSNFCAISPQAKSLRIVVEVNRKLITPPENPKTIMM